MEKAADTDNPVDMAVDNVCMYLASASNKDFDPTCQDTVATADLRA